jgi:replication-associated recombination protein RarA
MTGSEILADFRVDLAQRIAHRDRPPDFQPLQISPWLAMALSQKAVRRGRADLALQAAATLLLDAPDRLWRRCGCAAFEEIGVADPEIVGLVTVALSGKRIRAELGGEWAVASFIVEAMAKAVKCRSSDDLLMK